MSNGNIDLHKLPRWAQYLISLTVIAIVVALALSANGGAPPPQWIIRYLAPVLGVLYIILFTYAIGLRFRKRRKP